MRELARLVQAQRTTLVFTNTRSGAESATFWLKDALPALADRIECHHASLDRDVRQEVEDRLKRGELRAVVCSTSLELGIDIGAVDLVVMLASPKGVTKALQRTGRSGHDIHRLSRGLLMATNVNDLVECCATARLARARHLDAVRLPAAPLDVLAQQLVGLGCTARWSRADALALVRRSWVVPRPGGGGIQRRAGLPGGWRPGPCVRPTSELFGKLALDDTHFETRPGITRRDFLQNVGVIPNEGVTRVTLRARTLGTVEETFRATAANRRRVHAGGRGVARGAARFDGGVRDARGRTRLPPCRAGTRTRCPFRTGCASEIVSFRGEIRCRLEAAEDPDTLTPLDCAATRLWREQRPHHPPDPRGATSALGDSHRRISSWWRNTVLRPGKGVVPARRCLPCPVRPSKRVLGGDGARVRTAPTGPAVPALLLPFADRPRRQ